jgi:pilin isopeptide linkage protein
MMKMMRMKRKLAAALALCMLTSIGLPAAVCAETYESLEVTIPVSVKTTGTDVPEGLTYQIKIEGVGDPTMPPMPEQPEEENAGQAAGETTAETTGDASGESTAETTEAAAETTTAAAEENTAGGPVEVTLDEEEPPENPSGYEFKITYTEPGTYVYKISQTAGNEKNVTYDKTQYTVTVKVYPSKEKSSNALKLVAVISGENTTNKGAKAAAFSFENKYGRSTVPNPTVPETTRGGGGGGGGSDDGPEETTPSSTEGTKSTEPGSTEPSSSGPETSAPAATDPTTSTEGSTEPATEEPPDKPVYPDLPDIPVNPDGTPDIPPGTEIEVYDPNNPDEPVYRGPYSDDLGLPPGDYEFVMLDENGVPLASGLFTIDDEGVPKATAPRTGDTSILFELFVILMADTVVAAGILVFRVRRRKRS